MDVGPPAGPQTTESQALAPDPGALTALMRDFSREALAILLKRGNKHALTVLAVNASGYEGLNELWGNSGLPSESCGLCLSILPLYVPTGGAVP